MVLGAVAAARHCVTATLPDAADSQPDYFFWSGKSEKKNAADPWQRDLATLWPLVDTKRAQFHRFKDGEGIVRLSIRDDITGNLVKLGSHLFRNTFTVARRVYSLMGWDRIAQLIGDDQRTVEVHYGPYTEDVKESIAADLRQSFPSVNPEHEIGTHASIPFAVGLGARA